MNIVNKVTIRHIKQNRRQSLVTVIGIIISVAMITAVFTLGYSYLDLMVRKEIKQNGEWHVQYNHVTSDQIQEIQRDQDTKKLVLSSDSYATFDYSTNESKPYIYFKNFNEVGMEQFPIDIREGRLPQNENEVVMSQDILNKSEGQLKIGSKITIDLGERRDITDQKILTQRDALVRSENGINETLKIHKTKTVTIVGMMKRPSWEPAWSPGYTAIGYVDEATVKNENNVDALVILKDVKGSLFQNAKNFAKKHEIEKVSFNNELLRYYGVTNNDDLRSTIFTLAAIVIGVIIIGSIALIYNAFAISVSERAKHLGMLSSIGATKRQKRNSVFYEGLVIGAVSIPIGVLAGLLGMKITFTFINTIIDGALGITEKLHLVITPTAILIACGISILTIFISVYIPAQKASKISAIDAIRQTQDIKLTRKTVKTSKYLRKIFGIEAEIGLKNVKRYKKRYLATVFSLVISIILFLSISYFTDNLKKSIIMSQNNLNFDIEIFSSQSGREPISGFKNVDYVTKSTFIKEVGLNTKIEEERLSEVLKDQLKNGFISLEHGKYPYYVQLHALDNESYKAYAKQINLDDRVLQTNEPTAIVIENITYEDPQLGKIVETKAIEINVGDKMDLFNVTYNEENDEPIEQPVESIKIGAITNEVPMGVKTTGIGGVNLIISEATLKQLQLDEEYVSDYLYLNSSNPLATQAAIENIKESNVYVYNVYQERQRQQQMVLLMSIFSYGFISLIALISIANIFNTISTSVSLRKREFAMLRSVGMTSKGFNKMIRYESVFYGLKALIYGLPLSVLVILGMHNSFNHTFVYKFSMPWISILIVVIFICIIVGSAMLFSISKIKKQNIIEGLKQDNI